jgi:hypothetical protein
MSPTRRQPVRPSQDGGGQGLRADVRSAYSENPGLRSRLRSSSIGMDAARNMTTMASGPTTVQNHAGAATSRSSHRDHLIPAAQARVVSRQANERLNPLDPLPTLRPLAGSALHCAYGPDGFAVSGYELSRAWATLTPGRLQRGARPHTCRHRDHQQNKALPHSVTVTCW